MGMDKITMIKRIDENAIKNNETEIIDGYLNLSKSDMSKIREYNKTILNDPIVKKLKATLNGYYLAMRSPRVSEYTKDLIANEIMHLESDLFEHKGEFMVPDDLIPRNQDFSDEEESL